MDSDLESLFISLISQLLIHVQNKKSGWVFESESESNIMEAVIQIISFVRSKELDALPKPESKLMSLVSQAISLFKSTDLDSLPSPLSKVISFISQKVCSDSDQNPESDWNFSLLVEETLELKPHPELISLILLIFSIVISTNRELKERISFLDQVEEKYFDEGKFLVTNDGSWDMEPKLISLISELLDLRQRTDPNWELKITSLIIRITGLFKSRDLDSQPKPESKLMSLVSQAVSLFNSVDLESMPKPMSKLISLISQKVSIDSDKKPESELKFEPLVNEILELKPDHEIISLMRQILSVVAISMNPQLKRIMFLCPQVKVYFHAGGKFSVAEESQLSDDLWNCFLGRFNESLGFRCRSCNGEYHKEYERSPVEIKHLLHRKHSLQLALNMSFESGEPGKTRECYCCDDDLQEVIYFCSACDFAMNIACMEKPRVLYIPLSKWHEHPLALFPRKTPLTCDICALASSNSPFYICPPCDFVAHLKCIYLPRVLRISRHPHRIHYTPSFDEGNWSCSVCRRKIDNDYGGYSCIKVGCSYATHSRCATQSNVWDGIDLEGEPEDFEEVAEPFVRISDGIIQHFTHDHHHLRLDENTCGDYDDNKLCHACVTPIYFGNFYSCVQCEFVLHETCAHLSRKIYHPIHPHLLTLDIASVVMDFEVTCAACNRTLSATGFFYECGQEECNFWLHVQCATVSEPLVHRSHMHPLFLTSKPEEKRKCSVCQRGGPDATNETFNCIDECDDFALCFRCATLPQKLRYKHDKHILNLYYVEETNTLTNWCETCDGKIKPKEGFYICDEYCCVTLHIKCLIGEDLYMKPGLSLFYCGYQVDIQCNNHHMSRPICSRCEKRCPHKIVFQCDESIYCSVGCLGVLSYLFLEFI